MSRLVVVSNRVASIDEGRGAASAGGLAVGVLAALSEHGGLWFGWNGEIVPSQPHKPDLVRSGNLTAATVGMTRRDYNEYYNGFANSTLWPLFHYRLDLMSFDRRDYSGYYRVNARFARMLFPLLRVDDTIWVHDYHLIPLGAELRRAGAHHKIGFFLHTPLPPLEILLALPRHQELMRALCAYDLVGFQTISDMSAFLDYVVLEGGGEVLPDGRVNAFGRTLRADAFPIGVDVDNIEELAARHDDSTETKRLNSVLVGRKMIIGVDRLDYSKGLVQRFAAFERMLELNPRARGQVTYMQVAPPTRTDVADYVDIRAQLEAKAGHINGRFADFDWVPLRYLNKSFDRADLACFYRASRIGLVTPLRDGMNLVAKEYVAAQDPQDPGVLVLSRFAGAARQLSEALIVNPYDVDEVANALATGLDMRLEERHARWEAMMEQLRRTDIHYWRRQFMEVLEGRRQAA